VFLDFIIGIVAGELTVAHSAGIECVHQEHEEGQVDGLQPTDRCVLVSSLPSSPPTTSLFAGMTVVNDYGVAYICQSLPFGGVRVSGFGRINGREGLRECCVTHAVLTDRCVAHSVALSAPS
jgi:hypothetical protein